MGAALISCICYFSHLFTQARSASSVILWAGVNKYVCELLASVALIMVLYFQSITVHIICAFSILKNLTSQSN